jgi:ankyrin repeat protein
MNLIDAARNGDINTINKLLDEGTDPNVLSVDPKNPNNNGRVALEVASRSSNTISSLATVRLLLDRGANPNIKTKNEITALWVAARYSDSDSSF